MKAIEKKFAEMGARIKVHGPSGPGINMQRNAGFTLDILKDKQGDYYDLMVSDPNVEVQVADLRKKDRHLLLAVIEPNDCPGLPNPAKKFLCGHDERNWFVAGVSQNANNVDSAKQVLKPRGVVQSQNKSKVKHKNRHKRKNEGFVRQGEWFFLPDEKVVVDTKMILKKEPMRRGRGKPHMAEELYRCGGTSVHVHPRYASNGLVDREFRQLGDHAKRSAGWSIMARNAAVYVRGKIRHADHKTIELKGWHRVVPNNETQSRNVAFLD